MFKHFVTQFLGIKEEYLEGDHVEGTEQGFLIELSTRARRLTYQGVRPKQKRYAIIVFNALRGGSLRRNPCSCPFENGAINVHIVGKLFMTPFQFV
ncbi:hypothetical protein GCM10011391_39150 [Pullulanibacillus camelliae]|uniref:Uncharacterized protein n=1 Tax=Pullulanibacillus camelliae TaxID=1707096 RepID=A0A8J2YNA2_9BACL|nr:hypothetical protein [Pullulanibacillus camelliae]GGE56332.1 hypothetical protein GCM10011391_39150 [Pullulanibacillus camelliae]